VQVTGDVTLLDKYAASVTFEASADPRLLPIGRLPDDALSEVKDRLGAALAGEDAERGDYLQVPDDELFQRMISLATNMPIGDEFLGVVKEQAGFVSSVLDAAGAEVPEDFTVAVIGAGMTGIGAAIALGDLGYQYEIFEASSDIGGTWRINTYPGVAVDTPSLYYSFSYELEGNWSRYYPTGAEYQEYLRRVVAKYDVARHIRFNTAIESLTWDDPAQQWIISGRRDGVPVTARANAVITAMGYLNRPIIPNVPGRESFTGVSLHTAEWDDSVDLTGKRVAVVGTGATAVQVVDRIIDQVAHLTLVQRQPHWIMPNRMGAGLVSDQERWLQNHLPFYGRWQRARTYCFVSDRNYLAVRADPEWMAEHEVSISAANDVLLQMCRGHLRASFGDDSALAAKLTPSFAPHAKRIIRDPGGYYAALASSKADVIASGLAEVTPAGIVAVDGTSADVDVIIYATGFTLDFLSTLDITGRDGIRLADAWAGNDPRSYLAGNVAGFPNLFITSGPNSSNGHGGGHNFMTEAVVHYITGCLRLLAERGATSIEVTQQAQDEFVAQVDAQMAGSIWATVTEAHTYYRNDAGRVILPNPWRMVDYWHMLREPDESKFRLRGKPAGS
jgi:cation diffusion facilitator CzcD-associated flavoprotein CzcO